MGDKTPLPADTWPDERDWRNVPGERPFERLKGRGSIPSKPDDAAAFVVVSGRWDIPLTQAEWHDVEAADLPADVEIRTRAVQPTTETEDLSPEMADALGLSEGAKIEVEQPTETFDHAIFEHGQAIPAALLKEGQWVQNYDRLVPVDADGEPIELAEPEPEQPPEPTPEEAALAAFRGEEA